MCSSMSVNAVCTSKEATFVSNRDVPSLSTLPVELVYQVLDNLDILTIFVSFRDICKRLNEITDNYHRYKVSFKLILSHRHQQ